jgi:CRP-like cAMP-binding protein
LQLFAIYFKVKKIFQDDRTVIMMKSFSTNTTPSWTLQSFSPNETIPLIDNYFWLIRHGVTKTLTWDEEGKIVILGYWGSTDVIGQPLSQINPYEIRCLTYVEASRVPKQQWTILAQSIFRYIQQTEELFCILRCEPMQQRLLQVLTFLGKKFGHSVSQGQLIDLRLTHQELADLIGATRVTVTRILQQLEQKEFISRPRRHLIVLSTQLFSNNTTEPRGCSGAGKDSRVTARVA